MPHYFFQVNTHAIALEMSVVNPPAHAVRIRILSSLQQSHILLRAYLCIIGCLIFSNSAFSDEYYWYNWMTGTHFSNAHDACAQFETGLNKIILVPTIPAEAFCQITRLSDGYVEYLFVDRRGDSCPVGMSSNDTTGTCSNDEQKGIPPPSSCVGNPINITVGNKFQSETDYQSVAGNALRFTRYYNSLDGIWRHNYSTFIRFSRDNLSVVHADGRESFFILSGDTVSAPPTELSTLVKTGDGWLYTEPDYQRFSFDATGRLTAWTDLLGVTQKITYVDGKFTVTVPSGQSLTFTEDGQHQPLSLTTHDLQIAYSYDSNQHLVQMLRTHGTHSEQRIFHYEDARNTGLLTGITDERGIRFATWTYDAQGRAISSQHSDGAGLTQVAYNADGSSTVTSELGKQATYHYQQIGGVKRVTAIEGEPSPNCPASNSSYTYNDRGLVLTKTDAQGIITAYTYNDRGLEISRTEANGTPLAKITTTEWNPVRFLRTKVVEPTRTTLYTYDDQGRPLGQQIIAH